MLHPQQVSCGRTSRSVLVAVHAVAVWLPAHRAARRLPLSGFAERGDISVLESFARAGEFALILHGDRAGQQPLFATPRRWLRRAYCLLISKLPLLHEWIMVWIG